MNSNLKEKHITVFTGGMNTDLSPAMMPPDKYVYMLNCNVTSSSDGNMGIVTNTKGNIQIDVNLPAGENKTIGVVLDEERNKFYFAMWNSTGYHTWYMFDAVSLSATIVMQCITDTGGIDIFNWKKTDLILHGNIVSNKLLSWSMKDHPARKINVEKAMEKSDTGYGSVILEEYTRAYKKTADFPPYARYFTDDLVKFNHVYGSLYQFAVRFYYDDGEISVFSDFSSVAIPPEENVTGTQGIPLTNNAIAVTFLTGGMLVRKIELAMRKNSYEGGVTDFVSIIVFDKDSLGIDNNSEYTYNFYNDNTYLALDQTSVIQQYSYLPRNPECQEYVNNAMVYFNFEEGFDPVAIDINSEVQYEDLFIPDGSTLVLNDPFIIVNEIDVWFESGGFLSKGWRHTTAELVIGPDVKKGNIFHVDIMNGNAIDSTYSYEAGLSDTATTVANAFAGKFRTHNRMQGEVGGTKGWVDKVNTDNTGFAKFRFDIWNKAGNNNYHTFRWSVNPIEYATLKNTGNSVLTNKLGSARRFGIVYEDKDQVKSLTFGNVESVYIKNLNELGGLKKANVILNIKHKAPSWAKNYQIVMTRNLVHDKYIQVLLKSKATITTSLGEIYTDFSMSSFNTYKKIHENSTVNYEFKKGDRLRLQKIYDATIPLWSIPTNVIDYEIISYSPEVRTTINQNVIVDGTANVKVDAPDVNNIGSNIVIDGYERTIIAVNADGYQLDAVIATGVDATTKTYPAFEVINRNGVLRIKLNDDFPIDVEAGSKYALVEIYSPAQMFSNEEQENYYSIGLKFPIVQNNGQFYHYGNLQNQSDIDAARVLVPGIDNYVRNRELPTSDNIKNYQVIISSVEDQSFSDFYVSNLSSLGRPSRLDDATGVVQFDSRGRFSSNFIEDTKINGLSMFANLDRVDYNDKYGAVVKIMFYEGRLYIFKHLKYCWVPVNGNLITDRRGNDLIATSDVLLPKKPEYFLWEAGVGENPESIVRYGNDIFSVSPNSGMIIKIGGNGAIPISKQYGIDMEARSIIANASKSGARMYGVFDRRNSKYVVNVEGYEEIIFNLPISNSNHVIEGVPDDGIYQILTYPVNGLLVKDGNSFRYSANLGYSGVDSFTYKTATGITRKVEFNVLISETAINWRPIGQYCEVVSGSRTGYKAYSTLEEYDVITGFVTGNIKPNIVGDPNYVAPILDEVACSLTIDYVKIATIDRSVNNQNIIFYIVSTSDLQVVLKEGNDYSGSVVYESAVVTGISEIVPLVKGSGVVSLFIKCDSPTKYNDITVLNILNSYIKNVNVNDLLGLLELKFDQSLIPASHSLNFNELNVNNCLSLMKIEVFNHQIPYLNFNANVSLNYIDVHGGEVLSNIYINSWDELRTLIIHNCLFTSTNYSPLFIDDIMTKFNDNTPQESGGYKLQYGENGNSGVKPSSSMQPVYESLFLKSIEVIGKSPVIITEVRLVVFSSVFGNEVTYAIKMTNYLSVDIDVVSKLVYVDGDGVSRTVMLDNAILKETLVGDGIVTVPEVIVSYTLTIESVTPNPAGGINLIY